VNARTKACAISGAVKEAVYKRDRGRCILCGKPGLPEAHYIPRSAGGLGIEENIVTLCRPCHNALDQTTRRPELLERVKEHLEMWYPAFDPAARYYRRRE
jgi:5-methylcytosine-specific restriction endonuclease McrA